MTKITYSFITFSLFVFVFALAACGQKNKASRISNRELELFEQFRNKSLAKNLPADSLVYYASKALGIARQNAFGKGEMIMLDRLSRINEQYGNIRLAIKYEQQALDIGKLTGDLTTNTRMVASMAVLKAKGGNLKTGIELLQKALNDFKKTRSSPDIFDTYVKLGDVYNFYGQSSKALANYLVAESLARGKNLSERYFSLLKSVGNLYSKTGQHQKALEFYEKGVSSSQAAYNPAAHINFLRLAGEVLDTIGQRGKAMQYHQLGLDMLQSMNIQDEQQVRLLIGMAKIMKDHDAAQGIRHLKNALQISHEIGNKALSAEIYRSLNLLYKQQSQYQQALLALEQYHLLNDSLINRNKGHQIAVLQSSYELLDAKNHLQIVEIESQKSAFQRNLYLIIAVVVLIILLIGAFYIYNMRRLNRRLSDTNAIKDKLFSIIGHDLRNPIGGISQLLYIVEEGELDPKEQQDIISLIRNQGDRALEILNTLLLWGQTQLKGVEVSRTVFDPVAIVKKNLEVQQDQLRDKSITVNITIPETLQVEGDINHFDFIVRNLLSNAIKFSYTSGVIDVSSAPDKSTRQVVFSVKDHGKGISSEQMERFSTKNLDVSFGTKGEKGTGFGLMLSKEFVRANDGRLWVESREGEGATFYFTFGKS